VKELTPQQVERALRFAAEHPDLDQVEANLTRFEVLGRQLAPVELRTPAEVFKAVQLGIVDKRTARRLFLLPAPPRPWWAALLGHKSGS
jgi:hypothetical protein